MMVLYMFYIMDFFVIRQTGWRIQEMNLWRIFLPITVSMFGCRILEELNTGISLIDQGTSLFNLQVDLLNKQKSKSHVRLEPSSPEFWNWSFEEMAEFDLPAVLNYIKHQTRKKIHYVGHSQGGMIGIVALQNPKVSNLIRKADFLGKFSMWLLVIKLEKFNLKTCQSTSSFYLTSEGSSIQIHCSIHKKLEVKWSASSR